MMYLPTVAAIFSLSNISYMSSINGSSDTDMMYILNIGKTMNI